MVVESIKAVKVLEKARTGCPSFAFQSMRPESNNAILNILRLVKAKDAWNCARRATFLPKISVSLAQ